MRVFRFLRRFNTVAAAILLVLGIGLALMLAILALRDMGAVAPMGSGSESFGKSGGDDDRLNSDRLNTRGRAGVFLLFHRNRYYGENGREPVLVDARTGRHSRLLGGKDPAFQGSLEIEDQGLLLEAVEPAGKDNDSERLSTIVFVRYADFREFTIAEGAAGMDYGNSLTDESFSIVVRGTGRERTRLIVFDSAAGRVTRSVPLPIENAGMPDRSMESALDAAADDAVQAMADLEV